MSKTDGSKSFPSVELILYTPFSYIYIILRAEGTTTLSTSFPFIIICRVHIGYPTSIRPYLHGKYPLLFRPYPLAPHSLLLFSHSPLYYTLSYEFERCGCTLLAAWLSDSYGHDFYQIRLLD